MKILVPIGTRDIKTTETWEYNMALIAFSTSSGTLLQYDDATFEFVINPYSDSSELAFLGYDDTRRTLAQLSSDHDGDKIFSGRSDFVGDPTEFPFIVLRENAVITAPDELKDYVDRDVIIVYQGQLSYGKDQMTDNGDGTHYIDVPYVVYEGMVYEKNLTERWFFPSAGPFDQDYPQSITYNDPNGRSDTFNTNITYTEVDLPKILEIDGVDVSTGQVPLLNTTNATMPVKWLDNLGAEQNDTEPVTPHVEATFVNVVRQTTASVTYNHKTGLPIPTLLYYKDDIGTRVDFNGTYQIPDTVVNQPITLGWSITNGDTPTEIEQAEFTQTLTVDEFNDVIMPAFTDNWGNEATIESRTENVEYGTGLIEILGDWLFDAKVTEQIIDQGAAGNDVDVLGSAPIVSSMMDLSSGSTSQWARVESSGSSLDWMKNTDGNYAFGGWYMLDSSASGQQILAGKGVSGKEYVLYADDNTVAGEMKLGYCPFGQIGSYLHNDLSIVIPRDAPFHAVLQADITFNGGVEYSIDFEVFFNGVSIATFTELLYNEGPGDIPVRFAWGGRNNNSSGEVVFRADSSKLIGSIGKQKYRVNHWTPQEILDWYNEGA